jgi:hypothetical protein
MWEMAELLFFGKIDGCWVRDWWTWPLARLPLSQKGLLKQGRLQRLWKIHVGLMISGGFLGGHPVLLDPLGSYLWLCARIHDKHFLRLSNCGQYSSKSAYDLLFSGSTFLVLLSAFGTLGRQPNAVFSLACDAQPVLDN